MAMEGSRHLWTTAIVASATLAIVGAEIAALRGSHYVFKPLTTLLILAMAQRLPGLINFYTPNWRGANLPDFGKREAAALGLAELEHNAKYNRMRAQ